METKQGVLRRYIIENSYPNEVEDLKREKELEKGHPHPMISYGN